MDTTVLVATTATVATTVATLTTAISARDLLMPRLIPGMDTTVDPPTVATPTMAMVTAMATTRASKKGTSIAGLTGMKCHHFDDDLPNVLNFREESKRTKENILLLQTHCILTFIHFIHWYICIPVTTFRTSRKNEKCAV